MRVAPGIWAIGDMTGKGAFTHVSMYQAEIAMADILGVEGVTAAEYDALPRVTFTDPEIGSVGMTQAQATKAGINVLVGRTALPSTARGWIHGPGNDGLIKLIGDADRGVLVGGDHRWAVGRRDAVGARGRRPCCCSARTAAVDDLCVSDVPSRNPRRGEGPAPTQSSA